MRGRLPSVWQLGLGLLIVTAACGGDKAGKGFLDVGDLPRHGSHFAGAPVELRGRLALRANGCVTVVLNGVERMPLWPDGTEVVQDQGNLDRYVVTLPTGVRLGVDGAAGDAFSAHGIIDDNPGPFEDGDEPPGLVTSFLAYCGVKALPVAFPDAATFAVE
jgi:hypothetical protein